VASFSSNDHHLSEAPMRSKLLIVVIAVFAGAGVACGVGTTDTVPPSPGDRLATVDRAATTPAAPISPSPNTPARLVVPEGLVGMNAQLALERLEDAGFTNVTFASADPDDTLVLYPPNWHAVEVEPAPGTELPPDSTIILTCSKR
jgi:hypothetical protein